MGTDPSPEDVREWLNDEYIEGVTEEDDPTVEFNYAVTMGGWNIHVLRPSEADKIRVRGGISLPPQFLGNLLELPGIRRNFRTQLSTVLTGTSGFYQYLDAEEEACGFRDVRIIALEQPIYPDQVAQSTVMGALIRLSESLGYIQESVDMTEEDIDSSR